MIRVPTLAFSLVVATTLCAAPFAVAAADPPPSPSPSPVATATPGTPGVTIPANIQNSPIVQSILRAIGGVTQTTSGNTAYGKVTYFKRFNLQLETAPGVYRQINLHQGTLINPRGTTLTNGMTVAVSGQPQGDGSLNADAITLR